jgi:hypothetical protein
VNTTIGVGGVVCNEHNDRYHIRMSNYPYEQTHAHSSPINPSERLSQIDFEIHKVGHCQIDFEIYKVDHQERFAVDGNIVS